MSDKRLIGAVAGKGIGDDLCHHVRIGCTRPFRPVGQILGKFAIVFTDMLVADDP